MSGLCKECGCDAEGLVASLDEMDTELGKAQAEIERLRRPACGTEQVWLDEIRHDDEQALIWFRLMQRESEAKKKAMEENERLRKELVELKEDIAKEWLA